MNNLKDLDKLLFLRDTKKFMIESSKYLVERIQNLNSEIFECF